MKNSWKGKVNNKTKIIVAIIMAIAIICAGLIMPKLFKQKSGNNSQSIQSYALNQADKGNAEKTVQKGTVTIHYLNEKGEKIIDPTVKEGNVGESYDVKRQDISGYTKSGDDPISRAGIFELGNIDVNFIYQPATSEVYKKISQKGQNGATENEINVMFNNTRTQRDYGLVIITKDEEGNPIDGGEFTISKDDKNLRTGKVREGKFYAGKIGISTEGKITYKIKEEKSTIGYKKLEIPVNVEINSKWNDDKKKFEITLENNPQQDVTITINEKDEIVVEIINAKIKDMYEVEIVNKTETELVTGSKFKVIKDEKTLVDDFVKEGKLYVGGFEITGEGKDQYIVYETQTAEGYEKVIDDQNPGIVDVTKTFNQEKSKYEIQVKNNDITGFTAEIEGENKVTIYVETRKKDDKYDLSIKKFVSNIDGEIVEGREPIVTIKDGKIKYTQSDEIEKAANEQKVTYTLRTYNESNVKGKGKRIIEYIPDGLVFLPENEINTRYGWKFYKEDEQGDLVETPRLSDATIVATDYLEDKEIEGFNIEEEGATPNYLDIQVVFEVDESKITSEDRIIENRVKIDKNDNDPNKENDETSEKIYVKFFDLNMTKYIKEVKIKNNNKVTTKKVGEEQKGKLVKIDVAKKDVNKTTITVTYVLKVTNIGEIAGYATELVDYIPEDFKLVEDGIWKVTENQAVTTKLANKLLEPGESTEIDITFDWKLTEHNIGKRINEGKITKYENEYNAKDPTEDNNDKEGMLVAVRTGSVWVFIVLAVLIALCIILVIVYLFKKRNENEE